MTMTQDPDDFLAGGAKVPSAKFVTVGDHVVGTVVDRTVSQCRTYESKELEFWPDGNPKLQLVVTLQTEERDPSIENDDGQRRIYAPKPSTMFQAIVDVTHTKGLKLLPGGRLAVKYTGTKPHDNPRLNDIKLYAAAYEPPAQTQADDLLGGSAPNGAPAPQPAADAGGSAEDLL